MVVPRACVACLGSGALRLVDMTASLLLHYNLLIGLQSTSPAGMPRHLCYECAALLSRTVKFRNKCHRSYRLMNDIIMCKNELSQEDIVSINRENNRLTSSLMSANVSTLYCGPVDAEVYIKKDADSPAREDDFDSQMDFEDLVGMFNRDDNYTEDYGGLKVENKYDTTDNCVVDESNGKRDGTDLNVHNGNVSGQKYCDKEFSKSGIRSANQFEEVTIIMASDSLDNVLDGPIERVKMKIKKSAKARKSIEKVKTKHKKKERAREKASKGSEAKPKKVTAETRYQKFIKVVELTREEQLDEMRKKKESETYKNSPYKCDNCYKGFIEQVTYTNHMHLHDPKLKGDIECDLCKKYFRRPCYLSRHQVSHNTKYQCKLCVHTSYSMNSAIIHYNKHEGKERQCQHCEMKFATTALYSAHLRKKHPSTVVCELCGFTFVSRNGLSLHKSMIHPDAVKHPGSVLWSGPHCATCDVTFATQQAYDKHLKTSGNHVRSGESAQYMVKRSRLHRKDYTKRTVARTIECEQCGLKVGNSREYHIHFRKVHKDKNRTLYPKIVTPFMCELCGKILASQHDLHDHKNVHTGQKPHQCNVCGKKFKTKITLTLHMNTHKARNRYQCDLCQKKFTTKHNLQRHIAIHMNLQLPCNYCEKIFKSQDSMAAHIKHVHEGVPWPRRNQSKSLSAAV